MVAATSIILGDAETITMKFTSIVLLLFGLIGSNAAAQPAKPIANDQPNASQEAAVAAIKNWAAT